MDQEETSRTDEVAWQTCDGPLAHVICASSCRSSNLAFTSSSRARNWSEGNVIRQWRLHVQRESLAFLGTYIIHVVVGSCPLHTVEHASRPLLLCIVRGMNGDPHPMGTAAS